MGEYDGYGGYEPPEERRSIGDQKQLLVTNPSDGVAKAQMVSTQVLLYTMENNIVPDDKLAELIPFTTKDTHPSAGQFFSSVYHPADINPYAKEGKSFVFLAC